MDRVSSLNVLSLYSGAGLMDLGFEQAGFHTVGAVEFEPPQPKKDGTPAKRPPRQWATETWKRNRPGKAELMLNRDVRLLAEALKGPESMAADSDVATGRKAGSRCRRCGGEGAVEGPAVTVRFPVTPSDTEGR